MKENNGWYSLIVNCGDNDERVFHQLTRDFEKISKFSEDINNGDVSALHIDDIIEDFLP
jgi:hypothetical protein